MINTMKVFIIIILHLISISLCSKPTGVKLSVTKKALDYVRDQGPRVLNDWFPLVFKFIKKLTIGKKIELKGIAGKGDVYLNSIHIPEFKSPKIDFDLLPKDRMLFKLKNGMKGIQLENMVFNGAKTVIAFLVKIFQDPEVLIENLLGEQLKNFLCSPKPLEIFNKNLREKLPKILTLKDKLQLDYSLTSDPKVAYDFIEGDVYAALTYDGETTPVKATALPDVPGTACVSRHMLCLWTSTFTINTMLYSLHHHGMLNLKIDKTKKPELADFLRISGCSTEIVMKNPETMCFGTLLSIIVGEKQHAEYENKHVAIKLQTEKPPMLWIKKNHVELKAHVVFDVVLDEGSANKTLMQFKGSVHGNARLRIQKGRLYGDVGIKDFDIDINWVTIGGDCMKIVRRLIDSSRQLLTTQVAPVFAEKVNDFLGKGIDFPPIPKDFRAVADVDVGSLKFIHGAMQFGADVEYTGKK